jgi:NADPH2:quinone reductase
MTGLCCLSILQKNLRCVIGGKIAENVDLGLILRKRLTLTGSTLRPRPVEFKGAIASSLFQHVWPFLESGTIKPVIFKTFPLEQAADAHQLMESNQHIGKIVLTL